MHIGDYSDIYLFTLVHDELHGLLEIHKHWKCMSTFHGCDLRKFGSVLALATRIEIPFVSTCLELVINRFARSGRIFAAFHAGYPRAYRKEK